MIRNWSKDSNENTESLVSIKFPANSRLSASATSTPSTPTLSTARRRDIPDYLAYEKNERLAKRLFFDLPEDCYVDFNDSNQQSGQCSKSFLAESCVKLCFTVKWANEKNK